MSSSLRDQRFARTLDREIAPVYQDRFGRLILRALPELHGGLVLDVHCGTGRLTEGLLERLGPECRVLGLEGDPAQLAVARGRIRPEWRERLYFQPGDLEDLESAEEATYDLVVANLVLGAREHDWKSALRTLMDVCKPGGVILATIPLRDSWSQAEDVLAEILREEKRSKAVELLDRVRRLRPRPTQIADTLRAAGLSDDDFIVEHERFRLLFGSGREFLFAPVVEHGALPLWKAITGEEGAQQLFWSFKEAIDTYFESRVLEVTLHAGLIRIRMPAPAARSYSAEYWARYPEITALLGTKGHEPLEFAAKKAQSARAAASSEEVDIDVDIDMGDDDEPSTASTADDDFDFDAVFDGEDEDDAAVRNILGAAAALEQDLDGFDTLIDGDSTGEDEDLATPAPDGKTAAATSSTSSRSMPSGSHPAVGSGSHPRVGSGSHPKVPSDSPSGAKTGPGPATPPPPPAAARPSPQAKGDLKARLAALGKGPKPPGNT